MVSEMFRRYYESHGKNHMPCPSPQQIDAEFAKLKAIGLPDDDAWHLMALSGQGSMCVQNSQGGGRYPDFLKILRGRGFNV